MLHIKNRFYAHNIYNNIYIINTIPQELLENLIENGVHIFRINGAYCHYNEYKGLIADIERLCKKVNEIPTIIFDLKGMLPRIDKIFSGLKKVSLEKGETVKLICGDAKFIDNSLIHIDSNITDSVKEGDRIIADSSGLILKVVKIDYYKKEKTSNQNCSLNRRAYKSYTILPSVKMCKIDNFYGENEICSIKKLHDKHINGLSNSASKEKNENNKSNVDDSNNKKFKKLFVQDDNEVNYLTPLGEDYFPNFYSEDSDSSNIIIFFYNMRLEV